jgi:hypothetical protein
MNVITPHCPDNGEGNEKEWTKLIRFYGRDVVFKCLEK